MKRFYKTFLSIVLVASLSLTSFVFVKSDKMSNLKRQKESAAQRKNSLKKKQKEVENYLSGVDKQLTDLSTQIDANKTKLKKTETNIRRTKKKLKSAKESVEVQNIDMQKRIQFMYENGESEILDMILNSKSISDFLNKAEYISELSSYDRKMLNKLKATKDKITKAQKDLKTEKSNLLALNEKQKNEQAALRKLETDKKKELSGYKNLVKSSEESEKEIDAEIRAQQAAVAAAERSEQNYNNQASKSPKYKGGSSKGWTWPCPSCHIITSEFGYRKDPIHKGKGEYHSGIDIGAPGGAPVVAAASGTVAWAYYSSSAGNWIGISHGNGVVSVYMHMSALKARAGQHVNKGQVIGLVGTTGSSTGNHLHFGVQLNGSYVNPHNYVG